MKKKILLSILMLLPMIVMGQSGLPMDANEDYILFSDDLVKALCIENWDTNNDGELSLDEAAAVTDLNQVFYNKGITTFDELQYFTGLTSIGAFAFFRCSGLTSITIPNSVTSIGYEAFLGCSGLTSIIIPNNVTSIGGGAFEGTAWYNSQPDGLVYAGKVAYRYKGEMPANTTIILQDGTLGIASSAFYGCSGLTSVTIPDGVIVIGGCAFYGCTELISVSIPNSVTKIENYAFENCENLELVLPERITKRNVHVSTAGTLVYLIGDEYYMIEELTISGEINGHDFALLREMAGRRSDWDDGDPLTTSGRLRCIDFSNVKIVGDGSSYMKWSDDDYCCYHLDLENDNEIPEEVFCDCTGLTSVTIGNSVNNIGDFAFCGCTGLTSVTIGNSVNSIGYDAFKGTPWDDGQPDGLVYAGKVAYKYKGEMPANTTIILQDGTLGIASVAFSDCTGLTSITIPNSVTSIGGGAFSGCTGLTSITIPNSVTGIGSYAFSRCSGLVSVNISDLEVWCNICFEDSYSNPLTFAHHLFLNGTEIKDLVIPNSVTTIGGVAFSGCSGLTSISIPNSVTSIEGSAFEGCSGLTSITIPNSVTSISSYAFLGCSGLTSVTIPNSVTSIGWKAFLGCTSLSIIKSEISNPFKIVDCFDNGIYSTATLIVPAGKKNIYKNTAGWHNFQNIVEVGEVGYEFEAGGIRYRTYENNTLCVIERNEKYEGIVVIPRNIEYGEDSFTVTGIGENAFNGCDNLQEIIIPQTVYDKGIPKSITKFTTYSNNPMWVEVVVKGAVSATMKTYPIDEQGNTDENNCYTVTSSGLTPGQYIPWKLDDENYGIISAKTGTLTLETQPAQPTSTTKARLIATTNEADDDQHFGFEWLRYNAPSEMPSNKVMAPLYEGRIVGSLGGLNPDIYYKYRPFYQSDSGEMVYGEWIPFLTGDANVFFEPETHTKEAEGVSATGALLSGVWIEGTEDIQEKGFEYWTISGSNTRAVGNDAKTMVVSGNNTTVTIDGLIPGKEYGYRSYVKTESGTTYGEEMRFKTVLIGDVNGDGELNEADAKAIADHIMGNTPTGFNAKEADINGDNDINVIDIVRILNMIK